MENGMMPSTAVDSLLSFGYMIPGVANVSLEIDQEKRIVNYEVFIEPKAYKKYVLVTKLSKGGIFKKLLALILISKFNAPRPNVYNDFIEINARAYLPINYQVNVNVGKQS
jgi:hypothetical protein